MKIGDLTAIPSCFSAVVVWSTALCEIGMSWPIEVTEVTPVCFARAAPAPKVANIHPS